MLAFPSHLPVFGCLFGDLVGICGIMRHIKVLTCRIDTTECLFIWSLVTNYVILVLLYDRHGVSGSNMLDWDGALAVRNRMPVSLRGGGGELGNLKP
jgi:hypothetical protein